MQDRGGEGGRQTKGNANKSVTGNGQLANTQCAQHAIKYAAKHQSKAKSSRATRNCKRCALVNVPCVCVCVATCSRVCVCGCVWSVCQQLCCPLAPFASDSFIHCTARRSLSPVSLSNLAPSRPAVQPGLSVRAVAALRPHWHGHASQWQPTNLSQVVRT